MRTITIRRPEGHIEIVDASKFTFIDDALFARIKEATAAAGRGEALSYDNGPAPARSEMEIALDDYRSAVARHDPRAASKANARIAALENRR